MLAASIFRRLRTAVARFGGANQGNVAVIFAIAALPVLTFVGAAIDYSRANAARSSMQAALDSTALMLSKDLSSGVITNTSATNLTTQAQAYFTALYTDPNAKANANSPTTAPVINVTYTPTTSTGSTIQITGAGQIQTDFMNLAGFPKMSFNTTSTTTWGNVKMRVALALDNTGSMADNGKITALRTAVAGSGGLIDQLSGLAQNPGDVYISVIPFAKVVNVGANLSGATWIDWTDWLNPPTSQPNNGSTEASLPMNWHAIGPGSVCPFTNNSGGFVCTTGPVNGSSTSTVNGSSRNVIPSSGTYSGYICPSVDANSHTLYNGCWDSVATSPASGVFCSGNSNCACPLNSSGRSISGCSCTGSGSNTSCTGLTYTHHWTQPSVTVPVGFTGNKWTPTNSTPTVANVWTPAATNLLTTWTGCITDRTQNFDETGDAPTLNITATLFPANQYYENNTAYCSSTSNPTLEPIIPMTYNWSSLKTAVNAMQPTGGTDQSVGLAWAWQSLLQTGPIPAPQEDSNTTYNRVIIILSDGLNTEDRWPDNGNGSTQNGTSIDVRQAQQCANIKAAVDSSGKPMFTVYTIQVDTSSPPDPVSTVLQNCASDPTKFFMLTNSNQIATTFTTIGTALSQLRVSN
jgi:Flp pilus assembly protein TadG